MFIDDLNRSITSKLIGNIIRETFEFELSENELTPKKAKAILEDICVQIADFRNGEQYFLGERNSVYLSMLATAKYLTEYLREKKTLTEAPPVDPQVYHKGIQKGIGHGLDTTRKFVPHVAGSAVGAFVGGLKGQSLASEHGQVKMTNLEQELEMINPKNPASEKNFFDKQIKNHFSEYSTEDQKWIASYLKMLYRAGMKGNTNYNPAYINKQMEQINGNPFKTVDPAKRKELVNYFMSVYNGGKRNKNPKTAKFAGQVWTTPNTPAVKDAMSALDNLGYKRDSILTAIQDVTQKDKNLENNLDGLIRAAQGVIQK